ncbi:hypothetical protein ACFQ3B_18585 [Stackebrandtia endophytica]|uniref:hypothetical protein n=1 Tax=Stackebrandtia endophytica TaxID=1496996 RepID=UPI001151477A|nr:hypothetical protein [Stackebrandtia endophytica]
MVVGVGAYVSAVFGWFVGGGMITAMLSPGVRVLPSDILITAVFWVLAIGGSVVLWMLWRSGRDLVRAAAWWLRAPYVLGHRPRVAAGWVQARTVNTEPPVLARITTATFVFLFGIAGVAWLFRDPTAGLGLVIGVLGLLSLACGVGQMGGVIRLVSGLSEADPLWVRLRSAMRRS